MMSAKCLKLSCEIMAEPLANIFDKCILQGTLPSSIKQAAVSPVYAKKDPLNKEYYRPISVLADLSKFFEKEIMVLVFFQNDFESTIPF